MWHKAQRSNAVVVAGAPMLFHRPARELNICYNQLAYVVFGKCIEAGILQKLKLQKLSDEKANVCPK